MLTDRYGIIRIIHNVPFCFIFCIQAIDFYGIINLSILYRVTSVAKGLQRNPKQHALTHWRRVTQIYVGKLTIINSDNGLSPGRCQAIICTNAEILLIGHLETNFSEISIGIPTFSLKKISSVKCKFNLAFESVFSESLLKSNHNFWKPPLNKFSKNSNTAKINLWAFGENRKTSFAMELEIIYSVDVIYSSVLVFYLRLNNVSAYGMRRDINNVFSPSLTHRGRDQMGNILQRTFSNAFEWTLLYFD